MGIRVHSGLPFEVKGSFRLGIGLDFSQSDYTAGTYHLNSYEGSFSVRLFDGLFYIGAGLRRLSETHPSGAERKWNDVLGGVAIQSGEPIGTMFKLEASIEKSPQVEFDDSSLDARPETDKVQLNAELLFEGFLFSYQYGQTTYKAVNSGGEDMRKLENRYGVGMKSDNFSIGFYRYAGENQIEESTETLYEVYRCTIGYNFM